MDDDDVSALVGPAPTFGKQLASSDKETRDRAVKAVTRYLKQGHSITPLELAKVWKALFYCMWHSDKRAVQADLAERLAGLVHSMPQPKQPLFVQVFWAMMMREWHGIDRLRLDKFYMLMRLALGHQLRALCGRKLERVEVDEFAQLMRDGPLSPRAPRGIQFFLVDTFLSVLRRELPAETDAATWVALVRPFVQLMGDVEEAHLRTRAIDQVLMPLLDAGAEGKAAEGKEGGAGAKGGAGEEGGEGKEEGEEKGGDGKEAKGAEAAGQPVPPAVIPLLSELLFDVASAPRTIEANRPHLYALQTLAEERAGARSDTAAPQPGPQIQAPRLSPALAPAAAKTSQDPSDQRKALRGMIAGGSGDRRPEPAPEKAAVREKAPPKDEAPAPKRAPARDKAAAREKTSAPEKAAARGKGKASPREKAAAAETAPASETAPGGKRPRPSQPEPESRPAARKSTRAR